MRFLEMLGHKDHNQPDQGNKLESWPDKVLRHLREIMQGKVDVQAVARGIDDLRERIKIREFVDPMLLLNSHDLDYLGHAGLDRYIYDIKYTAGNYESIIEESVAVLEFPQDTILKSQLTEQQEDSEVTFMRDTQAFAAFVGPTEVNGLPNNGFMTSDSRYAETLKVPFAHTNPPGMRRGALAIDTHGTTLFLAEEPKWELIDAGFPEIATMVGCSFYYLGSDTGREEIYTSMSQRDKSRLTCFGKAVYEDGSSNYFFVHLNTLVPRHLVLQTLQEHFGKKPNIHSFIALEMELASSGCYIKHQDSKRFEFVGLPTDHRHDHWLLYRSPSSPA